MNGSATTLHQTLTVTLHHHGLDPQHIDLLGIPGVLVRARDGSAVVISNPYGDLLHIELTEYQGVLACRYPRDRDPAHPGGDFADPDDVTVVYQTPTPCEGDVNKARADIDLLASALATEVTRPLPSTEIGTETER